MNKNKSFIHLHTHSHYSLLDGLGKISDLVEQAKKLGMPSLALTDHGVMYGAIEFYQKCQEAGIKPIIGVEVYVAKNGMQNKRGKVDTNPAHLILLAENNEGYQNLIKLTTRAHLDGHYYKPRVDKECLKKYSKGVICLTACLGGEVPRAIMAGADKNDLSMAEKEIEEYIDIFGKDNFFLEVQCRPTMDEQEIVNKELFDLAKKFDLGIVATNDIHYVKDEDDEVHDILICVQTNHTVDEEDRMSYMGEKYSMKSGAEMQSYFEDHPEVVENTAKIAERCNVTIELGENKLPHFEVPEGQDEDGYLKDLCLKGLETRYGTRDFKELGADIVKRLDFELSTIKKMGFAGYFLIVQDFVNWAKEQGILVGPGRGSAAGSLVTYLLSITNLDPLEYGLLFERFLNPDRISMPDIDIDFADDRRDEVIEYVAEKYGRDRVAQIITFGTMAARAAVRDAGRALGFAYSFCDKVAKLIPMFASIPDAVRGTKDLREEYKADPQVKKLLDSAAQLEGVARHASTHACAVVIAPGPLEEYAPLQYSTRGSDQDTKTVVTQFEMHAIDDLGLLKMDFLGLKNLTILQSAIKIIEKVNHVKIDLENLDFEDKLTYKLFQEGKTTGVFQFESSGMKRYLKQLKPTEFEDLIAMVALYRPGPMQFIPNYVDGKHGKRQVSYIHPKLKPILEKTYGVAVYQEQIIQIARDLALLTPGEADTLRKAMGKKIKSLLDKQHDKFIEGCVKNQIDKRTAKSVWEFIEPFAEYGFNRSHAACYAHVAYQTANLKSRYPAEFMAALLTADQGNIDRVAIEVDECRQMGIEVLPPDINESFRAFGVILGEDGVKRIRFGLGAIKNVGAAVIEDIIEERKANGKYKDLDDLLNRVESKDFNKKSLESLVRSGAMEDMGERNRLLGSVEHILLHYRDLKQAKASGQTNLFKMEGADELPPIKLEEVPAATKKERLAWEKELLGLYISEHPVEEYQEYLQTVAVPCQKVLKEGKRDQKVKIGGIVAQSKKILTRRGDTMFFVTLEDMTEKIEVIVFPTVLERKPAAWEEGRMVLVEGKLNDKDGSLKVIADGVEVLRENVMKKKQKNGFKKMILRVDAKTGKGMLGRLGGVLRKAERGKVQVYVELTNGAEIKSIKTSQAVKADAVLKENLEKLLGNGSILMK